VSRDAALYGAVDDEFSSWGPVRHPEWSTAGMRRAARRLVAELRHTEPELRFDLSQAIGRRLA
jgi:hypothetical protein